jgi:hypothetical protein
MPPVSASVVGYRPPAANAVASVDVIEHCLAHVPANRVRAAYNRHQYQEERRAMLRAWADFLES